MVGSGSPLWEAGASSRWGPSEEPCGQASNVSSEDGEAGACLPLVEQVQQLPRRWGKLEGREKERLGVERYRWAINGSPQLRVSQ